MKNVSVKPLCGGGSRRELVDRSQLGTAQAPYHQAAALSIIYAVLLCSLPFALPACEFSYFVWMVCNSIPSIVYIQWAIRLPNITCVAIMRCFDCCELDEVVCGDMQRYSMMCGSVWGVLKLVTRTFISHTP